VGGALVLVHIRAASVALGSEYTLFTSRDEKVTKQSNFRAEFIISCDFLSGLGEEESTESSVSGN
jgi:hypothetical protein